MTRSVLRSRSRRRGMTLVEIMVVLAILGVLIAVLAVNVGATKDDADVETTKIQMRTIDNALLQYSLKHKGKYPPSSEGLEAVKKYLPGSKVPTDAWGNAFVYASPGTRGDHPYEVMSLGKDGKEGGEDAAADIYSWDMGE